jgi:hypothetical protein
MPEQKALITLLNRSRNGPTDIRILITFFTLNGVFSASMTQKQA